jgi:hypothetical protein
MFTHESARRQTSSIQPSYSFFPMTEIVEQDEMNHEQPRRYVDLADWYHPLTAPTEYAEEASFSLRLFTEALGSPPRSLGNC